MPDKLTAIAEGKSIPLPQTDELLLRKAHYLLRALDHDLRIKMLYFLHQKQQCTVTEIFTHFRLVQAVASQHLALLRRAGVVQTTRQGKHVFYKLYYDRLEEIMVLIGKLAVDRGIK
ncbi:ArsR/SmtB family transcription factor [Paracnuella aquatica]|uniref:ArsR/SmtB family transcription factor n=1 Tax=Paracnuella aquatica TaxID=2268757 RepID=UPI000DEF1B4D|nr:metalloregulator ArsR/SmtB family transcription factor [Paracnuella aquatica]RPD46640.1 ArsR family transcriptional regulator [Paracnuella aquatica]